MSMTEQQGAARGDVDQLRLPTPGRVGQGTAVEMARAVGEVQAAILVAQQNPRSVTNAIAEMEESCSRRGLAERAFYRYPRGGANVTGPSVHLARELARCWRNVQYGIGELRRDDDHRQSEMLAWAWDVQANTRVQNTFIVPHMRDATGGPKPLVDMRDIYENNTNNASRRVREAIFAILPPWYVEMAKELCAKALQGDPSVPMPVRVSNVLAKFATIGITRDQLHRKLGRDPDQWTDPDLAQLHVIYTSIGRGETTKDEEFPPERVTAAEIQATAATAPANPAAAAATSGAPVAGGSVSNAGATDEDWPPVPQPPDKQPPARKGAAK